MGLVSLETVLDILVFKLQDINVISIWLRCLLDRISLIGRRVIT